MTDAEFDAMMQHNPHRAIRGETMTDVQTIDDLREELEAAKADYELLANEMIYQGNSVQHWRAKACAYGGVVGRVFAALAVVDFPYHVRSVEPMLAELIAEYKRLRDVQP